MLEEKKEGEAEDSRKSKNFFSKMLFFLIIIVLILILLVFFYFFFSIKNEEKNKSSIQGEICSLKKWDSSQCENALSSNRADETCSQIDNELKDQCYFDAANKNFRQDLCEKISDISLKDRCNSFFLTMNMEGGME